jgi:hypothetical protein
MSAMRSLLLAGVLFCACTPVDPIIGTYGVTVTGSENQTAPTNSTNTISGMGTVSVTADKERVGYLVTFGEAYLCRLRGTKSATTPGEIEITDGQTCQIGGTNASTTDGKVSLDAATSSTVTLTVSYTYSGQVFGINYAGTGTRTYTGSRL